MEKSTDILQTIIGALIVCSTAPFVETRLTKLLIINSEWGFSSTSAWKKKSCCRQRGRHEAKSRFRFASKLRLDHGALVALLVLTPTPRIIAALRGILKLHNPIEENPGGMYDQCEELAGAGTDEILRQLQEAPEVKVLPHVDNSFVMEAARRALVRAGYAFEL